MKLTPKNYVSKFLKILCSMFMCEKKRNEREREDSIGARFLLFSTSIDLKCALSLLICASSLYLKFLLLLLLSQLLLTFLASKKCLLLNIYILHLKLYTNC